MGAGAAAWLLMVLELLEYPRMVQCGGPEPNLLVSRDAERAVSMDDSGATSSPSLMLLGTPLPPPSPTNPRPGGCGAGGGSPNPDARIGRQAIHPRGITGGSVGRLPEVGY